MKALKEKLREADEKLQTTHSHNDEGVNKELTSPLALPSTCNNCITFEKKIEELKNNEITLNEQLEKSKKYLEETQKDLEKEAELRTVLENQWQEKREAHKNEVHMLREQVKKQNDIHYNYIHAIFSF